MAHYSRNSVDHLLELLHWKRPHRLGGWFRLEDTRLLSERVHSLSRRCCWLLLQLQVECTTKLELAACLQLLRSHCNNTLDGALHILGFQSRFLCDGTVRTSCRQNTCHCCSLHGHLDGAPC